MAIYRAGETGLWAFNQLTVFLTTGNYPVCLARAQPRDLGAGYSSWIGQQNGKTRRGGLVRMWQIC